MLHCSDGVHGNPGALRAGPNREREAELLQLFAQTP